MRKVLVTFCLTLSFLFSCICFLSSSVVISKTHENSQVISEPKYRYEKIVIDDKVWIAVYDEDGNMIDLFPDSCGGGGEG